jgi:hypothetical protein
MGLNESRREWRIIIYPNAIFYYSHGRLLIRHSTPASPYPDPLLTFNLPRNSLIYKLEYDVLVIETASDHAAAYGGHFPWLSQASGLHYTVRSDSNHIRICHSKSGRFPAMEMYTRDQTKANVEDNPEARNMLRRAFEQTARWQPDFKGFSADLTANANGKQVKGTVVVKGPKEVTVSLPDADLQKWAEGQIAMIAVHRLPRTFEEADGKYPLTLEKDDHPLGHKLTIHGDGMHSFYRIQGDRITQINRRMPHMGFTINIEDSAVTQEGKYLTTRYTVYYYSPQDGRLTNVESFTDSHCRVASSDLPATRRIISYENGNVVVKGLTFSNQQLL